MLADAVLLETGRALSPEGPGHVLREVGHTAQQVAAVLLHGLFDQLRVGRQVVVGGEEFEPLAQREAHATFRVGVHPGHIADRLPGDARHRQERLRQQVERKLAPLRAREPRGVRRTLGLGCAAAERPARELRHRDGLGQHLPGQFCLAPGRRRQPSEDGEPGAGKGLRGQSARHVGHHGECPTGHVVRVLHRIPRLRLTQCKNLR